MQDDRIWILICKKYNGEITEQELAELEALLGKDNAFSFSKEVFDELWRTPLSYTFNEQRSDDNIWNKVSSDLFNQNKVKGEIFSLKRLMLAAALLLLIVSSSILYLELNKHAVNRLKKNTNQISTQLGSRSKIILPDGTKVWLNAGSKLSYSNFNKSSSREVNLAGEAFFEVVHDAAHPFIIHTNQVDIKDIGTSFDVKAYPGDKTVEATLVSGSIEVMKHNDPERKFELKPNEKIIIPVRNDLQHIQKTATIDTATTLYTITEVKRNKQGLLPQTAWVQNKLVFDNESFEDLAGRMEKWYNVNIHFKSEDLKQLRFSGIIEKETIEQALNAMEFSYPFHYQMANNDIWISK